MITTVSTNKPRIFVEFETDMFETPVSILVFMCRGSGYLVSTFYLVVISMYNAVPLQLSLCHRYGGNVVNTIFEGTTEQIYLVARIVMKRFIVNFVCVCVCV